MRYVNAAEILPEELTRQLQDYIQGEYLYIPAKRDQYKGWGELSGSRKEIDARNREIITAYAAGASAEELAGTFYLSIYAIRKIIYKK